MSWFRVDDSLPTHRKVLSIPRGRRRRECVGSWTICGAWCSANNTEGLIPKPALIDLDIPQKVADDLVAAGLWRDEVSHYRMHDYLDYNPTAEQVAKARTDAAERQRRARERARESRVTHASVTCAVTDPRHGPPDPTRPDPSKQQPLVAAPKPQRSPATPAKGTRIPDFWPIDDAHRDRLLAWGTEHVPAVELRSETENWQDWHRAKGDTAKDWTASWRTWMRRAQKDRETRPAGRPSGRVAEGDAILAEAFARGQAGRGGLSA